MKRGKSGTARAGRNGQILPVVCGGGFSGELGLCSGEEPLSPAEPTIFAARDGTEVVGRIVSGIAVDVIDIEVRVTA